MRKILLVSAVAFSIAAGSASANSGKGYGGYNCGQLVDDYSAASSYDQSSMRRRLADWVFGYYTGMNRHQQRGQQRDLEALTSDNLASTLIYRCRSRRSTRVGLVAYDYYFELPYWRVGV
ncbi:MAG: hypothetical protein R3C60_06355 [Parvularculaceae bacterium]